MTKLKFSYLPFQKFIDNQLTGHCDERFVVNRTNESYNIRLSGWSRPQHICYVLEFFHNKTIIGQIILDGTGSYTIFDVILKKSLSVTKTNFVDNMKSNYPELFEWILWNLL